VIKGGMDLLPVVGPSPLNVNPIFEIGPLEPRYSEWLVFEGVSVDEKGVQHYLGKNLDGAAAFSLVILLLWVYLNLLFFNDLQMQRLRTNVPC
jgi:formamidase